MQIFQKDLIINNNNNQRRVRILMLTEDVRHDYESYERTPFLKQQRGRCKWVITIYSGRLRVYFHCYRATPSTARSVSA